MLSSFRVPRFYESGDTRWKSEERSRRQDGPRRCCLSRYFCRYLRESEKAPIPVPTSATAETTIHYGGWWGTAARNRRSATWANMTREIETPG